ncbi:MAG: hypothetical protein VW802_00570 [Rhodospirillaceae bacterium]|jgi:hypothetical protein
MTNVPLFQYRRWIAAVLFSGSFLITGSLAADTDAFERAVRDCMDNGFTRAECFDHAERVLNIERSDAERYRQEHQRRHENSLRKPAPRRRHPGRRNVTRP